MDLYAYVQQRGRGAVSELHKKTGVCYSTLLEVVHGKRVVKAETAKRIAEGTDGAVSAAEILGL